MNKRLPYEEQIAEQLKQVSLPDENMAWADMKRRLEGDDDRFIPFWLRGCLLWGVSGILLLSLGWWIIRPEKWFEKKKERESQQTIALDRSKENDKLFQKEQKKQDTIISFEGTSKQQSSRQDRTERTETKINSKEKGRILTREKVAIQQNVLNGKKKKTELAKQIDDSSKNKNTDAKMKADSTNKNNSAISQHKSIAIDSFKTIPIQAIPISKADPEKKRTDSSEQNAETKKSEKTDSGQPKFSFALGLSLHQQLPVNGQKFVPYNSEGRKGTLADYIPSVYLRMYKKNNWFVQSEFRYGAPQYTKEFLYQQRTDSARNGFITQSTSLKKTYYHQLPLTFNYFVSKNLTVGTGIMWNKFVSAISSQDIVQHNNLTGTDSIISKGTILVPKITDSGNVFVRSWFQALFEAEYKWKRFSVGARYAIGLEPYIKFELPAGVPQQEKNSSIDIFLRYEFWRSRKK